MKLPPSSAWRPPPWTVTGRWHARGSTANSGAIMSSAPDWQRVRTVFHDAIQRPAAERRQYLDQQCGDEAPLRNEVESLLAAHERAEGFLDPPILPPEPGVAGSARRADEMRLP